MKIIEILEVNITSRGAFSQGLNAILQMKRICDGGFDFEVFSTHNENIEHLSRVGVSAI